ncbi:MAG: 50S ribosomal protein L14e [archaeon]|nr:50S ribosomal protein L14e [archaeon]
MMIDVGRVCTKTAGRENGNICLVIENIDDIFAIVAGPSVKKKRCNVKHLSQLPRKLLVSKGASQADASRILAEAGLVEGLEVKSPKKEEKKAPKKPVKKAEKTKAVKTSKKPATKKALPTKK